ncbi:hypothetical protein CAEBREN_18810 [Caenorhabditis brenneri]|uniref:7TM GPCR serpentine receptor class x (Srx) domain-containing protein n=1 Tax=Caenorhabditis brenneri TaxID=135651 RepID=G0NQT0_CAEBE|nr:hypothetical protein CAEBREN_18810 [Caenorhabditis brenneri]
MTYLDDMWMFEYSLQPLCQAYMNYNDITKITFFAFCNVVLDTITITRLSYKKQKSFSQGIAIFLGLSVYIFAPELVSDPIRAFLVSTLFWCFLHAFDGLTTILFNSDIQGYIRKSFEKRKSIIIVSSCIAL